MLNGNPLKFICTFWLPVYISLVNKSGYLRLDDFCTGYILTWWCLDNLSQTHQKLSDLKEKLEGLRSLSLLLSFLDFGFLWNFLFCCVFFYSNDFACGGILNTKFTQPLQAQNGLAIRVAQTALKFKTSVLSQKIKSFYRVNYRELRVFKRLIACF